MRLLIIEDNVRLAELMAEGLARRGMACDRARNLSQADDALAAASYDAVVVDLGLPDGDGLEWLRARRRTGFDVPALILTARGALEDRVKGLDAGADDYVVKPAEPEEIAARLRALLRRPGARATPVIEVGELRFDSAARVASFAGNRLELTRREADLLELLMRQAGSVVRRAAIENALYSFNDEVSPNAVEAVVSRLRRRLEDKGARHMLHTIRGLGYIMEDKAA